MHTFTTRRRVEFADTDTGGICHFSRLIVFMETAEHLFLESLGLSVHHDHDGQLIGWPRVSLDVDFKAPARFGEMVDIEVRVVRKGARSMTYGFTLSRDGQELATGKMTSVCCVLGEGKARAIPIPESFANKLDQAPA